jgi:glycosyltransferase involved in cell wall biosynthesis
MSSQSYYQERWVSGNQGNLTGLPTVSVVIAAFAMDRWDDLQEAVASVQAQTIRVLETVVVIDHNPALLHRAQRELPNVIVVPNVSGKGASGARNSGVTASHGEVVAFLDDDVVASPNWLESLLHHFADPSVVGVGGRMIPLWASSRPRWFPHEFDWAVGASYRGMPEEAARVRNVWSCNMAIPRRVFDMIGGFREDFGKVDTRSRPEDTDLCLRAATAQPQGTWIYEPSGIAGHRVPLERTTFGYFLLRCLREGLGKATLAALNGAGESTSSERQYARRVLPEGVLRGLRDTVRGDMSGGMRSIAIAAGFSFAAVGYLMGWVAGSVHRAGLPRARQTSGNLQVQERK